MVFNQIFDLTENNISCLTIKETKEQKNCYIKNRSLDLSYNQFILSKNTKTSILCEVKFYPSSDDLKYIPRLTFRKVDSNGKQKKNSDDKDIIL